MATVTSPLLSLGARGSIGKSVVYSSWKGVDYARQHVVPANPKTTAQVANRKLMQWVHDAYKYLDPVVQASWVAYAKGQPFTPANAWMSANQVALKGATHNDNMIFSKPVLSGPPVTAFTATAGAGSVTLTPTVPSLITGWTITQAIGIAFKQVVPAGEMEMVLSKSATQLSAPYTITISGLTSATQYVTSIWFQFLRPDGAIAYGASLNHNATPT
jgi:hypothetical protein